MYGLCMASKLVSHLKFVQDAHHQIVQTLTRHKIDISSNVGKLLIIP